MTHTYFKYKEGNYGVGQWLITAASGSPTQQFVPLFYVPSLGQALTAVNMLNGGARVATDALHLKEQE